MSRVIIILSFMFILIFPMQVLGDSEVKVNGILSLSPGSYILFPDGTTQDTKTLTGPQGSTGPKGDTGSTGPQGPAGPPTPMPTCTVGQVLVQTDNGWQCGTVALFQNAIGICVQSPCTLVCSAGWGDCDQVASNGCETSLTGNSQNCGGCGNVCASHVCVNSACAAATCTDGVKNGNEADVDCGGTPCSACGIGKQCVMNAGCQSSYCSANGTCQLMPQGNSCTTGAQCATGYCLDTYCTPSSCTGICTYSNHGTCTAAVAGTDPHNNCAGKGCNGTGACNP